MMSKVVIKRTFKPNQPGTVSKKRKVDVSDSKIKKVMARQAETHSMFQVQPYRFEDAFITNKPKARFVSMIIEEEHYSEPATPTPKLQEIAEEPKKIKSEEKVELSDDKSVKSIEV